VVPGGIVAEGLAFTYPGADRPALRDLDLVVDPGECLLVLGPSGAGKSTLALAIAGLLGREVPGDLRGSLRAGGPVGVVFQDPSAQVVMERVEDDVAFGLENRGWTRERMRASVPPALAAAGLSGMERRRTTTLSGGEQQRLALAGALAPAPPILVLDEPTANLDPRGVADLIARLAAFRAAGTTVVLVEHRVEVAWGLADRVLVIDRDGRPLEAGPPAEVVRRQGRALIDAGIWLPPDVDAALGVEPPTPMPAVPVGAPIVDAEAVGFGYVRDVPVVRDVDLVVSEGERLTVVGANGSGKSTLGRLLVGLLRPRSGRVRLLGDAPHTLRPAELARRAGYLFQDPASQFLAGTVEQEAGIGLTPPERAGLPDLMETLGLPLGRFGTRSPYALSGGEQRRLSLAGLLARDRRLLVLDEPTYGQDRTTYRDLLGILRERLDPGAGLVAITHDDRLVRDLGGRSVSIDAGRIRGADAGDGA
jgi:energy-coupling factor transporter ATP-binding protein EcfA2